MRPWIYWPLLPKMFLNFFLCVIILPPTFMNSGLPYGLFREGYLCNHLYGIWFLQPLCLWNDLSLRRMGCWNDHHVHLWLGFDSFSLSLSLFCNSNLPHKPFRIYISTQSPFHVLVYIGFTGADCSLKLCPKGDDPMTESQSSRAIILSLTADSGEIAGSLDLSFLGETISFEADASSSSSSICETSFESFENVGDVSCVQSTPDANQGANYTITFNSWPEYPHENNVFSHNGNPGISLFSCDKTGLTSGSGVDCEFYNSVSANTKEYTTC